MKNTIKLISAQVFFKLLKGDNKELMIVPGASHVDLYHSPEKIPFGKIEQFFRTYLGE